ncbi:hypothetical protein BpHYR1_045278 [Brachionus plicatilis]|uniref:Uncharacterized protein n=1 Tax=Brachionus plicatilis TaxID=10195 RepID=A0A3M7QTZ9_BRAPC|nr:hypothetical protein BpHYR1_045278 [Brachionus plicatilis]
MSSCSIYKGLPNQHTEKSHINKSTIPGLTGSMAFITIVELINARCQTHSLRKSINHLQLQCIF